MEVDTPSLVQTPAFHVLAGEEAATHPLGEDLFVLTTAKDYGGRDVLASTPYGARFAGRIKNLPLRKIGHSIT